ncbi:MAG: M56 family metallopeptidase [Corynebacteriales bacterium]|nr:M56 family metallopeptidase [Mycobacteriales bacterium]
MLVTVIGLWALAFVLIAPAAHALAAATWVQREPRAALVLWQALGLASGLALVGGALALALAPMGDTFSHALTNYVQAVRAGDVVAKLGPVHGVLLILALSLLAWLCGVTARRAWNMLRARWHHRALVDLVTTPLDSTEEGPRLLTHPTPAAYCLPGTSSRIVITTGALELLDEDELDAVLAHERAHLGERHDLVTLPFTAWASAFPMLSGPRAAQVAVAELIEMIADDRACQGRDRHTLAAALARLALSRAQEVPEGAMAAAHAGALSRVQRLLNEQAPAPQARAVAYISAVALLAIPTVALLFPVL